MARLFTGIHIPPAIAAALLPLQAGVAGAKWRPLENLHLTLRFIGDADAVMQDDIDSALAEINAPGFTLRLKGVGAFGRRAPRALWAGVEKEGALIHLAAKIEIALQKIGCPPEHRTYSPHVTLAYMRGARQRHVNDYVAAHAGFESAPFEVDRFFLYQSHLGKGASHYVAERVYALT